ncbi:MAG: serine/threonine-protein kinase, partial [Myxococcota bacterium]
RRVALKVYHRRGERDIERLLVEARMAAQLEHPGIVRILDLDQDLGAVSMEWLAGGSMRRKLERGELDAASARTALSTLAEAVAFAHADDIVHRDIKPSNVLLRADGRAVLSDFGLAMHEGVRPEQGEGTLRYAAPEQRAAALVLKSADVYSFGITLLEVIDTVPASPSHWIDLGKRCADTVPAQRPRIAEVIDAL